jgi:hypothetical protein
VSSQRKFIFDDGVRNTFLEALRRTGLLAKSARAAGTNSRRIKSERDVDKEFDADVQEALLEYSESVQEELHRRAIEGVEEDVYFQGVVVGTKVSYSDSLLTTLVKAKSAEFREKIAVDTTIHGGVLLTLPPAPTQEAWLESTEPAQLPAPESDENDNSIIDIPVTDKQEA